MIEQIIESWQIHNRFNLYLLAASQEHLGDQLATKSRNIGAQFAHMHSVRLAWLKQSRLDLPAKIDKQEYSNIEVLRNSLTESGLVVEKVLRESLENGINMAYFKPSILSFLAYLISHESHHRGQIVLALKQSDHALDKKTSFALWDWAKQ